MERWARGSRCYSVHMSNTGDRYYSVHMSNLRGQRASVCENLYLDNLRILSIHSIEVHIESFFHITVTHVPNKICQ
jgi:hypothetical protein